MLRGEMCGLGQRDGRVEATRVRITSWGSCKGKKDMV